MRYILNLVIALCGLLAFSSYAASAQLKPIGPVKAVKIVEQDTYFTKIRVSFDGKETRFLLAGIREPDNPAEVDMQLYDGLIKSPDKFYYYAEQEFGGTDFNSPIVWLWLKDRSDNSWMLLNEVLLGWGLAAPDLRPNYVNVITPQGIGYRSLYAERLRTAYNNRSKTPRCQLFPDQSFDGLLDFELKTVDRNSTGSTQCYVSVRNKTEQSVKAMKIEMYGYSEEDEVVSHNFGYLFGLAPFEEKIVEIMVPQDEAGAITFMEFYPEL